MLYPVVSSIYAAIAAMCLLLTLLEGWASHDGWPPRRLLGLLACLVWPLPFVAFVGHDLLFRNAARLPELTSCAKRAGRPKIA
ncbi:hypothetical protein [Rhizobium sp. Root708]|uniref:hypothetical protein n=1 Tax=Rhizobium sp. Root708 TaxID=1736592 RepID=UPI000A9091F4